MKLDIKTDKKGICEYFKISNQKVGEGIFSVDIILNDSNDLNIELIIDEEYYNFIKEKSCEVCSYPAIIKINNNIYRCMFYNQSIFVEPKIKLPKSISKIKIIDDLSLEDYCKVAEQKSYMITIGNKKVKYYASCTVVRDILGNLKKDVTFIEY